MSTALNANLNMEDAIIVDSPIVGVLKMIEQKGEYISIEPIVEFFCSVVL